MDIKDKKEQDNYPLALKNNIDTSFLEKVFNKVSKYINEYLTQFNKYKS